MNDIERQFKLEADTIQDGVVRHFKNRAYQLATDTKPVSDLVTNSLDGLADAILDEQLALRSPECQKMPGHGTPMLSVDHEKQALITLGTLLNAISWAVLDEGKTPTLGTVAYEIGQRCRLERIYDRLRKRDVDLFKELLPRNRSRNAAKRAQEIARKADDLDDWSNNYRSYHLGLKLIELAVRFALFQGQPVFELQMVRKRSGKSTKTPQTIALTKAASDWIANHPSTLESLPSPVHMPMIIPPRPWTSLAGGGYLMSDLKLLKYQPKRARQALEKVDLSPVLSAINALQNTPYCINRDIYWIMRKAWESGNLIFGLKTHTFEKLPPRLHEDADPKLIEERNRERSDVFNSNNLIKGLQNIMAFRLSAAERFLDEPHIYFPYQLDYRGRAYPVPQLMNPQSDDIGRSLLQFAEGKPLGVHGAYWLAIHLFNCYWKGKKVSLKKRREWVQEHEQEILDFAADPLRPHRFWDEADKPWMFLAACLEWRGYVENGPNFISHLPVSMDGSCNGYQHLSAMGCDPIGGSATNLLPFEEPQDIYQNVADLVTPRIRMDAETGRGEDGDAARQLLEAGTVDRDDVKPATMTTPYGVTRGTIVKQLLESKLINACKDPKKCAWYLAKVLEKCIREVAVEAGKIMGCLRETARIIAKANRGMAWTAPTGFLVLHEPRKPKAVRVVTSDRTLVVHIEDENGKIDWRKMADGIVAHLVHSLDAAHMIRTTNRLYAEGVRHFAMVHDSFGVHACDVDRLNRVLREEFVGIYSEPVLRNFFDAQRAAHPDLNLPALPPTGSLDIRQVLESRYFFA